MYEGYGVGRGDLCGLGCVWSILHVVYSFQSAFALDLHLSSGPGGYPNSRIQPGYESDQREDFQEDWVDATLKGLANY